MDKDQLAALDRAATQGVGPQLVVSAKLTCTGCSHLKTEWWKDYLDNDETDSGTSARCGALLDEYGGKSITAYWSNNSPPPKWCPLADKPRTGNLVLIDDGAVERLIDTIEDAGRGYSIQLVRLVDGEATYDLTYRGETTQHPSHSDALEALRELARQEKIAAALAALGVK